MSEPRYAPWLHSFDLEGEEESLLPLLQCTLRMRREAGRLGVADRSSSERASSNTWCVRCGRLLPAFKAVFPSLNLHTSSSKSK